MLVLGLILILLVAVVVVAMVGGAANDKAIYSVGNINVHSNVLEIFLFGAATLLVLLVGLALLRRGTAKANQRRKDSKKLKKLTANQQTVDTERERIDERAAATDTGSTSPTNSSPDTSSQEE